MDKRDVAVVLSGGGMNGVLLEVGFLQRLRESDLWPRIARIYGTSAGALTGLMAALDRLDDLEEFVVELQPDETFRPQSLWRQPLNGLHRYELPETIAARIAPAAELAAALSHSPMELVVFAADVTGEEAHRDGLSYELEYSSLTTPPEVFGAAVMASAAISALVLPLRVGDRIATDGGWVRNYPLARATQDPDVELVVAFRYVPQYPRLGSAGVARLRERLQRFRAVPPVRAFIAELQEAEERAARGEPVHLGDMLIRLMRVAIQRNTTLEEQLVAEREAACDELSRLRDDVVRIANEHARPGRRRRAAQEIEERFAATTLPRRVQRITVHGTSVGRGLDAGFRTHMPWPESEKQALIARGRQLADDELRRHDVDGAAQAS
ncbi:MAG TPA: patatin-like phospholipase family protein [Gaiellaceae bacterium]|nr:patatin-like phospholipase family protein [Gaiellaceae bacterium]